MKKYISWIWVLMFLFFTLTAFAAELSERFADSEYGYSLKYPAEWNAKIHRSGMVLADINSSDNNAGLQVRITHNAKLLDDFVQDYINQFIQDMQAQLISQEYLEIDNNKAYSISFESNRRGKGYLLKSYIIPGKKTATIFIFQAGAPYNLRHQIVPILDAIAESFQLD